MSKGIVKITPTVTRRKHPGKLEVKEIEGADNQGLLNTQIDFDSPTIPVSVGDYVEFSLNLAGMSTTTKKIFSRGIVRELNNPTTGLGTLRVTVVNPNSVGVSILRDLSFYNYDSLPLAVNDYVEFINMNATDCQVIRKIDCVGTIQSLPGADPATMKVNKVGYNTVGISVNSIIPLTLSYLGTAPFRVSDVVEFRVVGRDAAKYVQLLLRP